MQGPWLYPGRTRFVAFSRRHARSSATDAGDTLLPHLFCVWTCPWSFVAEHHFLLHLVRLRMMLAICQGRRSDDGADTCMVYPSLPKHILPPPNHLPNHTRQVPFHTRRKALTTPLPPSLRLPPFLKLQQAPR